MTYLLSNKNHIVNFGSYMLPILEAIFFYYVGSRNIFFPSCLINSFGGIYLEKKSLVKLQRKVMFPNIIVSIAIHIQINR